MKKLLLCTALIVGSLTLMAQQKKLPPKITIELTDKEYIEFYKKVDSLMNITATTSNAPAAFINPFLQRFGQLWFTIDHKVALQMVADTDKKKKP